MEDTEQHEDRPGTGQMKNKSYDEILVHLGIKKEEVSIWLIAKDVNIFLLISFSILLYLHPLIVLRFFLSFLKFSLILKNKAIR